MGQRFDQPGSLVGGQRLTAQVLRQVAASDVLQHEVGLAVVLAHLEDLHHVGMQQTGRRPGLVAEAGQSGRSGTDAGRNPLDRDRSMERAIAGPIDNAHAAAADLLQQLKGAKGRGQSRRATACRRGAARRVTSSRAAKKTLRSAPRAGYCLRNCCRLSGWPAASAPGNPPPPGRAVPPVHRSASSRCAFAVTSSRRGTPAVWPCRGAAARQRRRRCVPSSG